MTYFPIAETHDTGEAYFESLGLLGGSTGMVPVFTNNTTFASTPDAYGDNLTFAITDSVLKVTRADTDWANYTWNLGATYDKVLGVAYFHGGNADPRGMRIGFDQLTYSGSQVTEAYTTDGYAFGCYNYGGNEYYMGTRYSTASGYLTLGTDTTIYNAMKETDFVFGIATYLEDDVQKGFLKFGSTSQWFQVLSAADGVLTAGWQSFKFSGGFQSASVFRQITPFYVWGAV